MNRQTKLYFPRVSRRRVIGVRLDNDALTHLERAHETYTALLGQPVSQSLVARRALSLLSEHLGQIASGPEADRERQLVAARG